MAAIVDEALEQRMTALQTANDVRQKRSYLKRNLKKTAGLAESIVTNPPVYAEGMKVRDLLLATPKLGKRKTSETMAALRISPEVTIGELRATDRNRLAAKLAEIGGRPVTPAAPRGEVTDAGFARRLREARVNSGLRQSDVARAINYAHHVSISHWENGYRIPAPSVVRKLAEVLEVDAAWLGGWSQ